MADTIEAFAADFATRLDQAFAHVGRYLAGCGLIAILGVFTIAYVGYEIGSSMLD